MNVLLLEDEKQLSASIVEYLRGEGYRCEAVATVEAAWEKIIMQDYDCILLDITLPDGNGLSFLERIKDEGKLEGVIIISAKDSLDDRVKGLKLGADDYLSKPFHLPELSARIEALIRRKKFQGSNRITFNELVIDCQSQSVKVNETAIVLTRKEYDLLLFLLSNKGKVISKTSIAEHLSGDMADMIDNYGFIYTHIKNLKRKLIESGCADYLKTVYGFGYKWQE